MLADHDLALYYRPTCPFCVRVLNVLKREGIDIPLVNISNDENATRHLVEVGGKRQVPCLFIDGKPLYESLDIIAWILDNA